MADLIQDAAEAAMVDYEEIARFARGRGIDGERLLSALLIGTPKACLGMPDPLDALKQVRKQLKIATQAMAEVLAERGFRAPAIPVEYGATPNELPRMMCEDVIADRRHGRHCEYALAVVIHIDHSGDPCVYSGDAWCVNAPTEITSLGERLGKSIKDLVLSTLHVDKTIGDWKNVDHTTEAAKKS